MVHWHNDDEPSRPLARIDLTPLIGLLAVLLALFALATPATQHLPLPLAEVCGPVDWFGPSPRNVRIDVDAAGLLSVDGARIERARLPQLVASAVRDARPPYFHLHVAAQAHYQAMVSLLDVLAQNNARYFTFEP